MVPAPFFMKHGVDSYKELLIYANKTKLNETKARFRRLVRHLDRNRIGPVFTGSGAHL